MTAERWAEAQRLFESALALPEAERAAYLASAASDAELAALVTGLLDADAVERSGEGELVEVVSQAMAEVTAGADRPPVDRLGPYKLLTLLGEGGMGSVFLAERDDDEFLQRVAVKIVRGGLDGERVRQFRAERQILAWLEHPNIARLLDGGTTDRGLPYLVMEHVEGEPIDRYADAHRLPVRERLQLFLTVCDAVSHAHRSLIVHRDIKPSNIIVTASGSPKLLDFGIARLALGDLGAAGAAHGPGRMMTPGYASPEVVRGGQVTTAADVYALGVLLYELLTGRRPLRFSTMTSAEIERVVCHVDPPPPSAVALDDDEPPGAAERAACRGTTPGGLRRRLAGDLDAIVARALHKNPSERYASVEALAGDVRRHVSGEPVLARPATWAYVASRFVTRHRWTVAAATSAAIAVSGAAAVLSVQTRQLALERDRTARERDGSQQVLTFVTGLFDVTDRDPGGGDAVTARELLERGAERVDIELAGQPLVQSRILGTIATDFTNLGLHARAAALLQRGLDLRRATLGPEHLDTAESMADLAAALRALRRFDEAESLGREALAIRRRLKAPVATVAASEHGLGRTLAARGQPTDAEPLLRQAVADWTRAEGATAPVLADGLDGLADALLAQDKVGEGARALEDAIAIRRRHYGGDDTTLARLLGRLGRARRRLQDLPGAQSASREALAILRKVRGDAHPDTTAAFGDLAAALRDAGEDAAAEPLLRAAVAGVEARLGRASPEYVAQRDGLAALLQRLGRSAEAAALVATPAADSRLDESAHGRRKP